MSPTRQRGRDALVVTWNLKEAFERADLTEKRDVRAAAQRLATALPRLPDVVLLQEVIGSSAAEIARLLTTTTKKPYEVVAAPPATTHIIKWAPPRQTIRDSAILVNQSTMEKVRRVSWIATTFDPRDRDPEAPMLTTTEHPVALLEHRGSGQRLVVVVAHFVHGQGMTKASEDSYKASWLRQIGQRVERTFGADAQVTARVIAGDLNTNRCVRQPEKIKGKEREFWKVMTAEMGYLDAVYVTNCESDESLMAQYRRGQRLATKRIDYIFVKGNVKAASHDLDYDPAEGSEEWATDHRLVYALVDLRKKR
jgi:endonuclease/exonuclease/phosphatase family metal-dependent hydrolase